RGMVDRRDSHAPADGAAPADDGEGVGLGSAGGEDHLARRTAAEPRHLLAGPLHPIPRAPSLGVGRRGVSEDLERLDRRGPGGGMHRSGGGPVQIGSLHRSRDSSPYSSMGTGALSSTPHSRRKRSRSSRLSREIASSPISATGRRAPAI